jgi:hypothetical protein
MKIIGKLYSGKPNVQFDEGELEIEPLATTPALYSTVSAPRRRMKDEGRPLGAGLQEQASNHLELHWLRTIVVSVKEKAWLDLVRYESRRRIQVNR